MNRLIDNAIEQDKRFGNVNVRHYLDRTYQNFVDMTISLEEAVDLINEIGLSLSCVDEDIHISAVR